MYLFYDRIDKTTHIQAQIQSSKEEYTRKRIYNGCLVWTENSVTQDNFSASWGLPSYPHDGIFKPQLTTIKDIYNPFLRYSLGIGCIQNSSFDVLQNSLAEDGYH